MNSKEQALYALMEEEGYSHGLITTTLYSIRWSKEALDELIIFIMDTILLKKISSLKSANTYNKKDYHPAITFPSFLSILLQTS